MGKTKAEERVMMNRTREWEKEDIVFVQHYEAFRSLNAHMWQIPMLAVTITGGLLATLDISNLITAINAALLFLAFISNYALILVLHRTRFIMGRILEKMREYGEKYYVNGDGNHFGEKPRTVMLAFTVILFVSGCICLAFSTYIILSIFNVQIPLSIFIFMILLFFDYILLSEVLE
jgi:hypothetical protein